MAVTATLAKATPGALMYLLAHDGAAGDTLVITSATLRGDVVAGPLKDLLDTQFDESAGAPNKTVQARRAIFGDAADVNRPHCKTDITKRIEAGSWRVDADQDAVDSTRIELNVEGAAGVVAEAYLLIHFQHSEER